MSEQTLPAGTIHSMVPTDMRQALTRSPEALATWYDITPLARNEWICWVEEAKKTETRVRRIRVSIAKLTSGTRRPCCWAGCSHREKNGR